MSLVNAWSKGMQSVNYGFRARTSEERANRRFDWAAFALWGTLVCALSSLLLLPKIYNLNLESDSFSVDEPGWIAASYYYTNLVREGDTNWDKWDCPSCGSGSSYGSLNMHLGEWLIGVPLTVGRPIEKDSFHGYYDIDRSLRENTRLGNVPSLDLLIRARRTSAIFAVLCCLAVFAIGYWTYHAGVGLIASAFVAMNPVLSKLAGQVMTDTFYNLFLLCACLCVVFLFKAKRPQAFIACSGLAGIAVGLACSVKVTGIVAGTFFVALTAIWCLVRKRQGPATVAGWFGLFLVSALIVTYALNPLFWPSWQKFNATAAARELHSVADTVSRTNSLPWKDRNTFLADGRYPQLKNLSHPLEFPLLFSRWTHMMRNQESRGWAGWHGPRVLSLNATLFALAAPAGAKLAPANQVLVVLKSLAMVGFAGAGIFFLVRGAPGTPRSSKHDTVLVPLMYLLGNYLLIAFFMRINWDRYYLPTIIALEIIVAVGIFGIGQRAWSRLRLLSKSIASRGAMPQLGVDGSGNRNR